MLRHSSQVCFPLRPVAGRDNDADERGCGQHCLTPAQERPRGGVHFQSRAAQSAGLGKPGRGEALRDRFADFRPEQRAELIRVQPLRIQLGDAHADRLGMQPRQHPHPPVLPVVGDGGQRFGKLHVHHPGGENHSLLHVAAASAGCMVSAEKVM